MPFSFRTATIVACFCASTLAIASAPGLAIAPDKIGLSADTPVTDPINVAAPATVPTTDPSGPTSLSSAADTAKPDFSSLAAAVAAQPHPETVDDDLACMSAMIYFEAKGEPLAGQLAVAQVVLNRMHSGRFPKSICSVVTQRGQFSFVRGGRLPSVSQSNPAFRKAVAVARVAMNRLWDGDAAGALFFHASRVTPGWRKTRVAAIGNHIFYR